MKFLIDTSSLVAMVRYYIPFEKSDSLKNLIKDKIQTGDMVFQSLFAILKPDVIKLIAPGKLKIF